MENVVCDCVRVRSGGVGRVGEDAGGSEGERRTGEVLASGGSGAGACAGVVVFCARGGWPGAWGCACAGSGMRADGESGSRRRRSEHPSGSPGRGWGCCAGAGAGGIEGVGVGVGVGVCARSGSAWWSVQ